MRYARIAALLMLIGVRAFAQQTVPQPTNTSSLAWDYTPTATQAPLSAIHHFDVQWTATGAWSSTGKLLTVPLPTLTAGAYAARVRVCRTADASDCTVSAPLVFTVAAPAPLALATPVTLRLSAGGTVAGTTYFTTNFTTGTAAPLGIKLAETGACVSSKDFVDTQTNATASLRCSINANGAASVLAQFPAVSQVADKPADPALNRDFYVQYRFVIGVGSVANAGPSAPSQWKLHKSTYGVQGSNTNGWAMVTFNPNGDGLFTEPELWNNSLPNQPFTSDAYPHFSEGQSYEIVRYYRRDSSKGCGYYGLWVNGQQRVHTACLPFLGTTTASSGEGLALQDGAVYQQNGNGPYVVYNLYMRATDFPIGGVAF